MLKPFGITDIGELDEGRVAAQINLALRNAAKDCANRPGLESRRKVTVTFFLSPETGEEGVCDSINLDVQTKTSAPPSNSRLFNMNAHPTNGLVFNAASEDNVHQSTLDEIETENETDG